MEARHDVVPKGKRFHPKRVGLICSAAIEMEGVGEENGPPQKAGPTKSNSRKRGWAAESQIRDIRGPGADDEDCRGNGLRFVIECGGTGETSGVR
jgi:hypothetical protein